MSRDRWSKRQLEVFAEEWFSGWLADSGQSASHRGNVSASLIISNRLLAEPEVRAAIREVFESIDRKDWRGWLALRPFVTANEGQIAGISGRALQDILAQYSIYEGYLGSDAGRSSRGNFRSVRIMLEHLPPSLLGDDVPEHAFEHVIKSLQRRIVEQFVVPALAPNPIRVDVSAHRNVTQVLDEIFRQARSRKVAGCVAQHLLAVKLARVHGQANVIGFDKPCSAKDRMARDELSRDGDLRVGDTAFHVTVAPKPELLRRFAQNRDSGLSAKLYVLNSDVADAMRLLQDPSVEVNGLQSYISHNTSEWGGESRARVMKKLAGLIDEYNEHVSVLERANSGIEIELAGFAG